MAVFRFVATTRHGKLARDVNGVDALRAAVGDALADPDVTAYQYWPVPDLDPARIRCHCGDLYAPGVVRRVECRCGIVHIRYRCARDGRVTFDPPYHDGCGPLPIDPSRGSRI